MNNKVFWPDGTKGSRPSDGFVYADKNGTYWQWDDFLEKWSRGYGGSSPGSPGDIFPTGQIPGPLEVIVVSSGDGLRCTCGNSSVGSPRHSHYCDLTDLVST